MGRRPNKKFIIIIIMVVTVIAIALYQIFLGILDKNISLKTTHVNDIFFPVYVRVNGWMLIHLFFYMILGFFFPDNFMLILLMGICWEIVEIMWGRINGSTWWYGGFSDVIMNTIGFTMGYAINKAFYKKSKND